MAVFELLTGKLLEMGALHFSLLDPDKVTLEKFVELAKGAEKAGSDAIMIGGSYGVNENTLDDYIEAVKREVKLPIILFPGSVAGLSRKADAVLFLSVLNSTDPYYIIGAQVQAAVLIAKRYRNLETIPMAYIIVGEGGAAGFASYAKPIPYHMEDVIVAYVLAAHYLGFPLIYIEAGSGAREPVPPSVVAKAKRAVGNRVLIVGGGIRSPEAAYSIALAGADVIVTGTVIEESPAVVLKDIVDAVHKGGRRRLNGMTNTSSGPKAS
ncbi:MAG: geranylgeranylglyceryl/heptaprenylglyceryl phosphate synthase [Caldivirga sp.]|jgi:phosphoglycerol geranylgeranyltransferase|uniref:geranylgeranylglyceryl/heptaprenylglyceryl phosphate synthase n=1 Tax=Caldivirga sp. MU80 TaxID=1650354 RepID=UPI0007461AEB|nr:geranylgeranylglyceryl/heptaprenylglyceryl phosphate synthase [Caldivirga sp. MU80]KUO84919.1 MAG: geranylgeranylglyceryl/heptaprenylglyceryl phosphate synthase [Caldivirga sp. MG_3]NAZ29073.1 geranylgeranylglyceryl/heptaprenylglyceryl phosphate synthase [Caldivirga sp.]